MVKKQKIKSLIEICTKALMDEGYSESNIIMHRKKWNRVCQYMEKHSIRDYSAEVGTLFFNETMEKYPSHRQTYRRSVNLLTDYLFYGKIRKRIVPCVNHELPGAIGEVVKDYIAYISAQRYKKCTQKEHQRILSYFIKHLSIRSVTCPSDIDENDVLSFIASIENCKRTVLGIMRLFCNYLYEQKTVSRNIGYVIGQNNYPIREKLPSVYNADEIKQIENAVDRAGRVGKRNYAMLLLATRLGLRASDIAGLHFNNLDWDRNVICLSQRKTARVIELPLLTDVGESIIDYVKYGRPVSHLQQIFLSARAPYCPATSLMVHYAIKEIIKSSKVNIGNRKAGPHAMRHTLASQLLRNGTALPVISEVLGHSETQTTMEYLRIDFNGLMNCTLDVTIVSDNFYTQKGGIFYE
jgi:site-specific recombinase XerD